MGLRHLAENQRRVSLRHLYLHGRARKSRSTVAGRRTTVVAHSNVDTNKKDLLLMDPICCGVAVLLSFCAGQHSLHNMF